MFKRIRRIIYILIAILIIAVAVNLFLGPHSIAAGGITGLAIILEKLLGFERFITILVANGIIMIAALIFLGKEIFFNSLLGALVLPLFIAIVPQIKLVDEPMLSMIAGSTLMAIAASILYANHASSGGTSLPPLMLKKYFGLSPSIGLLISDGIVVAMSLVVFSVDSFFYAIVAVTLTAIAMGYIESGLRRRKMVYIISDNSEPIMADIMTKIERGVTLVPVIGAYERKERDMVMVTMDSKNYRDLLAIVKKHDENAFMITNTVSAVHGQGFTYNSGSV